MKWTTRAPTEEVDLRFLERFLSRIGGVEESGCIEWQGYVEAKGYGLIDHNTKTLRAHRVSWALDIGPIPDGMCVCHHCDNPKCVNPEHLFLGDNAANTEDMKRKGRVSHGEHHCHAVLDADLVRTLRRLRSEGRTYISLAREFGVGETTVYNAVNRLWWRHVDPAEPEEGDGTTCR